MEKASKSKHIAIIGPESSGKTTLAKELAMRLNFKFVPEYARIYCESLDNHPITYNDVINIGKVQIAEYKNAIVPSVFDAPLITSNIWLHDKWKYLNLELHKEFCKQAFALYLLCTPDIAWEYDNLRSDENRREDIFIQYKRYLETNKIEYKLISGDDFKSRVKQALSWL